MTNTGQNEVYLRLKSKAVGFDMRPGERLNEGALARELGVSRTPVREALNRLVAERLVDFKPGLGFFCRALEPREIFDLYETRRILEEQSVMLAANRADAAGLDAFRRYTLEHGLDISGLSIAEAVNRDEAFHVGIAKLSGNAVLTETLERINERIRFIRWVRMASKVPTTKGEHLKIVEALAARDTEKARSVMSGHIAARMDQVVEAVREGISTLFIDGPEALSTRILETS